MQLLFEGWRKYLGENLIPGYDRIPSEEFKEQIRNLNKNDWLIMYHGTTLKHLQTLINGFDATEERSRYFSPSKHPGMFVTPSINVTSGFTNIGGFILELKVRAANLHGTDYGGNIGRKEGGDKIWRDDYPNSFRPSLSDSLLSGGTEPQALLLGLVSPKQILKIYYNKEETWYTREEFLKLGLTKNNIDIDLSSPNISAEELFAFFSKQHRNLDTEEIKKVFQTKVSGGKDAIRDLLMYGGVGVKFGKTAANSIAKKIIQYFNS